jgi:hypothetical protein
MLLPVHEKLGIIKKADVTATLPRNSLNNFAFLHGL